MRRSLTARVIRIIGNSAYEPCTGSLSATCAGEPVARDLRATDGGSTRNDQRAETCRRSVETLSPVGHIPVEGMLLTGTVVVDSETVIEDGAVDVGVEQFAPLEFEPVCALVRTVLLDDEET